MCEGLVREDGDSLAFHPGYYVRELMESHGLDVGSMAGLLRVPADHLADLMDGRADMTLSLAARMSVTFGASAWYWLNLQAAYDDRVGRIVADRDQR